MAIEEKTLGLEQFLHDQSVIAFQPEEKITVWRGADRIDPGELLADFDLTVEALFASLDTP
jgi:hypothetical protein